jgi:hypothetical protein
MDIWRDVNLACVVQYVASESYSKHRACAANYDKNVSWTIRHVFTFLYVQKLKA